MSWQPERHTECAYYFADGTFRGRLLIQTRLASWRRVGIMGREGQGMGEREEAGQRPMSLAQGRLCVVLAACLWSTSGAFTKLLREDTGTGLHLPPMAPLQIAFFRVLLGGLALTPFLRRADLVFRPGLVAMGLCYALMNAFFVSAMAEGSAANAILLQYTAPLWLYLVCVVVLREPADRRGAVSVLIGVTGIGVIVWGGWHGGQLKVVLIALGSGITYAVVLIGLRVLRGLSPIWLTVCNNLTGALVLIPFIWALSAPSWPQMAVLLLYGTLQMALPYWLVARGLKVVSPQEAGTLTLLEPLLNPLWAYLVSPATERPTLYTACGGAFILVALLYRYWPLGRRQVGDERDPA